jgi:CRISPR/Cas system Type II protein with McrA/HNH and RuvC-like nuclease domain
METVLVLNFDYTPLNVTSIRRGFVLVDKGKAEILKEYDDPIITTVGRLVKPLIIRLLKFINYHNKKDLKISRQRIYQRDGFQCVYCGTHKNLTIDHVMPKSRGGANSWENMVTCCFTCNSKKGSKTPEEANMSMRVRPYKPSVFSELVTGRAANIWQSLQKEIFN